ncbi:MAG: hypothetical protein ACTS5I_06660 [Rhodanobacter sp.]
MKRLLAGLVVITLAGVLSGCYYSPGYSYVRGTPAGGDAYYGQQPAPAYDDGYYPGYYGGYGYGCCYAPGVSVGISSVWYGGSRYHRGPYRNYRGDHRGQHHYRSRGPAPGHQNSRGHHSQHDGRR